MGCGKSTIGRKLSQLMGWPLLDTDQQIEQEQGCSVSEIFEKKGESYFRILEQSLVERLSTQSSNVIVSTGGGLPIWGSNMELLNEAGVTVYIKRTAENIASRLSPNGRYKRPKLRGLDDRELVVYMADNISQREPTYLRAKLVIDAVPLEDRAILERIVNYIDGQ